MADATGDDEEMPDGVGVRDAVRAVEEYSGGIEEPARAEQRERPRREENEHGLYGDDAQPAHEHVGDGREGGIAIRGQDLEDYPDRRESPRQAEKRPAQPPRMLTSVTGVYVPAMSR